MGLLGAFAVGDAPAKYEDIARYVRETYLGKGDAEGVENKHVKRRRAMEERIRFHRDGYEDDVEKLIDIVFDHKQVRAQRKKLTEMAMAINVTKRIVETISSVYQHPPSRALRSQEATRRYRRIASDLEFDELLPEAEQLLNLCNEVLLWRGDSDGLRIVTPDMFDAVPHPRDKLEPVAYLIDWAPVSLRPRPEQRQLTHYKLWDDSVVIDLDADGHMIGHPREHGMGMLPGVLVHRRKPTTEILDSDSGRDIIGAHKAVVLLNLMTLRLSKSQGENQPVLKGILARMASQQPMDGETPIGLPPEVDLEMLRSKTDPDHFLKTIRHWIAGVSQAYGMSYEQFVLEEGASSGKEYRVKRERLMEIRRQQAKRWRRAEAKIAELLGFDSRRMLVDFHELALPQDPLEEVKLLDEKMRKGLDNPISWMMRKNPDLDEDQARRLVLDNIEKTAAVWSFARSMNMPLRSGDADEPGDNPEQNGARQISAPDEQSGAAVTPTDSAGATAA